MHGQQLLCSRILAELASQLQLVVNPVDLFGNTPSYPNYPHPCHRYIYIPLGGTKHAAWSTIVVFTFVALWHDLSLKLLTWGWAVSLFILPELLIKRLVPYEKVLAF